MNLGWYKIVYKVTNRVEYKQAISVASLLDELEDRGIDLSQIYGIKEVPQEEVPTPDPDNEYNDFKDSF